MAGLRLAWEDRRYTGGVVFAVWLAGLVGTGLLYSVGPPAPLPAATTASPTEPAPPPTPGLAPAETLPPTVVIAERADVYGPDCARAAHPADRRCAGSSSRRDSPGTHSRAATPADPRSGSP